MFTRHNLTRTRYLVALSDGITDVGTWQARNISTTEMGNVTLNGPDVVSADSLAEARRKFSDYAEAIGRADVPTDTESGYGGPHAEIYDARTMDALDDPYSGITPDVEHVYTAVVGPRGGIRIRDYYGSPIL